MLTEFSQLRASKVTLPIREAERDLVLIRYLSRELMILNADNEPVLHYEYPIFPGRGGLFNGNPLWHGKIQELLDELIQKSKNPAIIYFSGLRNEYAVIQRSVKEFNKNSSIQLPQEITCNYITPDLSRYSLEMQLKLERYELDKIGSGIEGISEAELAIYSNLGKTR